MKEKEQMKQEKFKNVKKFIANSLGGGRPLGMYFKELTQSKKYSKPYSNPNSKPQILNSKAGITLIALIITIIVMLILVAVTVSVALNGGLIGKAQEAKTKTEEAMANEQNIGSGKIEIDGQVYNSIDEYLKGPEEQEIKIKIIDEDGDSTRWIGFLLDSEQPRQYKLKAEVTGTNDTVTWSVDNPAIVELKNTSGSEVVINAKSEGLTKVYAEAGSASNWRGVGVAKEAQTASSLSEYKETLNGKSLPNGISHRNFDELESVQALRVHSCFDSSVLILELQKNTDLLSLRRMVHIMKKDLT